MQELKAKIYDETNGISYTLMGNYYSPDVERPGGGGRPIGRWGRMPRAYLEEHNTLLLNHLVLSGRLHSYLADLNEQAQDRYRCIVHQMMEAEGVTGDLKRRSQWDWIQSMNSIVSRAEEIIKSEMINT